MADNALHTFATSVNAQREKIAVHANNLANLDTVGFKAERPIFHDMAYETRGVGATIAENGWVHPTGVQVGRGVFMAATVRNMAQGGTEITNRDLDLVIQDKASFLQVEDPEGQTLYTRAGSLTIGPDGFLESNDGYRLIPNISIPEDATDIAINANGQVYVRLQGAPEAQEIGAIETAKFIHPAGLEAMGNTRFRETPASGNAQTGTPGRNGFGALMQGALEKSNAQPLTELTGMMASTTHSAYGMEGIKTVHQMKQQTAQMLG